MRRIGLEVPQASVFTGFSALPETWSFGPSSEYIRVAGIAADYSSDPGEEILVSSKDVDHGHGFHVGEKWWMIDNGYLSLPNMAYNNFGRSFNPIADEPLLNVTVGGSVSGNIDVTGDTDDIEVFLTTGQTYHVSLRGTGATPLNDSFLEVYDPSAALVDYDDDGGNDLYSMMTFTAAATGNYIIRASSFSNPGDPGTGGYTVDVRVQGTDAVGDTNGTSVVINVGEAVFGFRETATVSGGNDLDRYAIELEGGKFYTFKLAAGADYETDYTAVPAGEIDTILRLRNAAGTLLASNDDVSFPSDISSAISFLVETTGTYYLDVTGYAGQTGGYLLESEEIDPAGEDPLDSIRWFSADNIDTIDVNGTPTAYVYFGLQGENFGQSNFGASWGWNAKEKAAVMSALLEYTKITGIQYVETLDQNLAEFRLNTVNGPNPPVSYGAYFFPQDPVYGAAQGVGIFNVNSGGWDKPGISTQDIPGNQVTLDKGGFAYAVILHEFGHAHGVAHPHDTGGGSDVMLGVAGSASYGIYNLNQGVYTVMSYNDAWDFHPDGPSPFTIAGIGNGWSGTLGAFDIAVLQERYGVHEYATGDNVYTIANTQGTGVYYETIWDTGGTDTIAYNGTGNARIDLTAATLDYSPTGGGVLSFVDQIPGTAGVDGIFGGFTIANGVVIENAFGGSGNDTLIGNSANNIMFGNLGADIMMGRDGDDLYYADDIGDQVMEEAGGGNDRVYASVSYALAAGQEVELLAANATGIALIGNDFGQTIMGGLGSNFLLGGGGVDTLDGGAGDDMIFVDGDDLVVEAIGGGNDTVFVTGPGFALNAGAEVETLMTSFSAGIGTVAINGNEFGQTIIGNDGSNFLLGGGGVDTLDGRGGDDTIFVDGDDLVVEAVAGGNDTVVVLGPGFALNAGAEVETIMTSYAAGTGAVAISGNEFGQTIIGNAGSNFLLGGGGVDTLDGGAGDDTYIVDADDMVVEAIGGGNDLVAASSSFALNAGAAVETLSTTYAAGTGAINLTGNEFGQTIIGNEGANILDGMGGNDTLIGGGGADTFAFSDLTLDTIVDMTAGTDLIALDDAVFTAVGGLGALNANAFAIGTGAQDADDRIIYDDTTGALYYDVDGVGGVAAIQFATLSTGLALTASDFVVI